MIQRLDLRGRDLTVAALRDLLPRPELSVERALEPARTLIDDVRARGEAALLDQAERFDGVRSAAVRVPQDAIDAAVAGLDAEVRAALDEMIRRVTAASRAQVPPPTRTELAPGAIVEQRWQPVERVGLYVPGGKAVYPSSVVMNVVPAQVAQVAQIAIASPAQADHDGLPHPSILAAAGILGITEVYAMGGAGAIGALAYGVEGIGLEPVNVITGPGNVWVAAAKRAVSAVVGIDAEAGPTEILVLADATANPRLVAVDLLSQAEHDELAAAVLVTDSANLADAVARELEPLVLATKHSERVRTSLTGRQSAIVLVDNPAAAALVTNVYGPEHLEIHTANPDETLASITTAGAIFLGTSSPVPLGDYLAGSNHVLPTGGQAAHAAGLGAYTFLRPQQIIRYDAAALAAVTAPLVRLAEVEDLPAHGAAVTARSEVR